MQALLAPIADALDLSSETIKTISEGLQELLAKIKENVKRQSGSDQVIDIDSGTVGSLVDALNELLSALGAAAGGK